MVYILFGRKSNKENNKFKPYKMQKEWCIKC